MEPQEWLSEEKAMEAAREDYRKLLAREYRGRGDMEAAMYRLQTKYGLDFWSQWQVRHRNGGTPKFFVQARLAWLDALQKSVRRDLEALRIEQAKGGEDAGLADLITEAEALLAKIDAKRAA